MRNGEKNYQGFSKTRRSFLREIVREQIMWVRGGGRDPIVEIDEQLEGEKNDFMIHTPRAALMIVPKVIKLSISYNLSNTEDLIFFLLKAQIH